MHNNRTRCAAKTCLVSAVALAISGCGGDSGTDTTVTLPVTSTPTPSPTPSPTPTPTTFQAPVDPANFIAAGLTTSITTESCTLSGGTFTTCYRITTVGAPADHDVGTFCPRNIADAGAGIWIESGTVYDLTGAFIENLATFYNDSNWKLYADGTGDIFVTDTQEAFEAAARPDVAAQYQNHCVEGKMSYVGGGISRTYVIPVDPVPLASGTGSIGGDGVGVALNGINIDPPAPVDAIKRAYTIAAFDDCGGHINPNTGYHYHAATGCTTAVASTDGHSSLFGYALDGYGVYAQLDANGSEPTDLDNCRGHSDDVRGYHYHAAAPGENMHIGCFAGEQGSVT